MRSVDDAAVATYPGLAVEEERSFLVRVMGWILPFPADPGVASIRKGLAGKTAESMSGVITTEPRLPPTEF